MASQSLSSVGKKRKRLGQMSPAPTVLDKGFLWALRLQEGLPGSQSERKQKQIGGQKDRETS